RSPADPAFVKILEVAAKHKAPVVIHQELDANATRALEAALTAVPAATIVLAHGGESTPDVVDGLLARHPNLVVDLSGMHFQRTPALATEKGPLDQGWKALIARRPDRFLIGIDVWAARLFEPAMLDRLMTWPRSASARATRSPSGCPIARCGTWPSTRRRASASSSSR